MGCGVSEGGGCLEIFRKRVSLGPSYLVWANLTIEPGLLINCCTSAPRLRCSNQEKLPDCTILPLACPTLASFMTRVLVILYGKRSASLS